ncbi:hypothetical protein BH11PAT4_BH11PAT4_4070 [soil metagenome]
MINDQSRLFALVAGRAEAFISHVLRLHTANRLSPSSHKGAILIYGNQVTAVPCDTSQEEFLASETYEHLLQLAQELSDLPGDYSDQRFGKNFKWHGAARSQGRLCVAVTGYDTDWGGAQAGVVLRYFLTEMAKLGEQQEPLRIAA